MIEKKEISEIDLALEFFHCASEVFENDGKTFMRLDDHGHRLTIGFDCSVAELMLRVDEGGTKASLDCE